MIKVNVYAFSVKIYNDIVLVLINEGDELILRKYDLNFKPLKDIIKIKGKRGFILYINENSLLLGIDDKLVLVNNHETKVVLTAHSPNNLFWHAASTEDAVFIQEYGESPTGIYISRNLVEWRELTTNVQVDRKSKHFHYIIYDFHRDQLLATLGDGNLVRAVFSEDHGITWKSLYKGPWQFVPIKSLKNEIIFGMDSGIARGGIGVYYPEKGRWNFIFLKWLDRMVRFAQMSDLKLLSNGVWLAVLGTPQAILASENLETWYPVYVEGFDKTFNIHMTISEGTDVVACSTGRNLLLFKKSELKSLAFNNLPVMVKYQAYLDRLKGVAFVLKRELLNL
ncbi:MAG: hypothetical protein QXF79_01085 [Ignisphaera sp.]